MGEARLSLGTVHRHAQLKAGPGHEGECDICQVLRLGPHIWGNENQVEVGRGEGCIYFHRLPKAAYDNKTVFSEVDSGGGLQPVL